MRMQMVNEKSRCELFTMVARGDFYVRSSWRSRLFASNTRLGGEYLVPRMKQSVDLVFYIEIFEIFFPQKHERWELLCYLFRRNNFCTVSLEN